MKKIFVFRYLEVYFAAIIILQVIRCRHNIVDCHFCLREEMMRMFFYWKAWIFDILKVNLGNNVKSIMFQYRDHRLSAT